MTRVAPAVRWIALCGLLVFAQAPGWAAPARTKAKAEGWKRQVQAGINVTEGNTDATHTRAQLGAKGRGEGWEGEVKLRGEIGDVDGTRNRERVLAEMRYQDEWTPRAYLVYRMDFLYDAIADIDYRVVASPSFGYYLIRDPAQSLRGEAGPAAVLEDKGGEREAYPALRLAEFYEGRVTANARILQGIEYLPELRTGDGTYLLNGFVELKADLDAQLTLHVRLESKYDSDPADGKEKQDTTFSTSIGYTF